MEDKAYSSAGVPPKFQWIKAGRKARNQAIKGDPLAPIAEAPQFINGKWSARLGGQFAGYYWCEHLLPAEGGE